MAKIFYIHLKDEKQVMGYFFNDKRKAEKEGSKINDDFEFGLNGVTMGTPTFGRKDVYSGEIDIKKGLLFYRERLTGEVKMEDMSEEDAKSILEEIDGVGAYFPAKLKSGQSNAYIKRQGVNAKGALWSFYYGNLLENRKPAMKYILTNEQFLNEAYHIVTHNKKNIWISDKAYKDLTRGKDVVGYTYDEYEGGHHDVWVIKSDINTIEKSKTGLSKIVDQYAKYESKFTLSQDEFLKEAKSDFVVYHNQYSSAIDEVEKYAKSMGYELDQEEYGNAYVDGFFKPNDGQTKKDTLTLYKKGKEQKKALHVQIYGMGNKFELNMYIN